MTDTFEIWLLERIDHVDQRLTKHYRLIDLVVRETLVLVLTAYRKISGKTPADHE